MKSQVPPSAQCQVIASEVPNSRSDRNSNLRGLSALVKLAGAGLLTLIMASQAFGAACKVTVTTDFSLSGATTLAGPMQFLLGAIGGLAVVICRLLLRWDQIPRETPWPSWRCYKTCLGFALFWIFFPLIGGLMAWIFASNEPLHCVIHGVEGPALLILLAKDLWERSPHLQPRAQRDGDNSVYNSAGSASPLSVTITTSASPTSGGTTSGGGTVNCGSSVSVTATAASCYQFVSWTENGTVVSTSSSYTFTANANRNLVANFSQTSYAISTSASPSGSGTITGGGNVTCGSSVTVTATAGSCYRFVNWTENGTVVSTSAGYTFTANANRSLLANFTPITYTISASSSPSAGGSVNGSGTVNCGSSDTVTASANSGYTFPNWTENGTLVSSSDSYSFIVNGSRNLLANFTAVPCTYTFTTSASPSGDGTVSGGGTVNCSSSVTVTAIAASCYQFVSWTENGTVVSTSASYTFTAGANRSLVANLALTSYSASPYRGEFLDQDLARKCVQFAVKLSPNYSKPFVGPIGIRKAESGIAEGFHAAGGGSYSCKT